MNYKTPGVYVEEKSLFPPSVAQVETAIPAFIGYTQKGPSDPTEIGSMLEYEQLFGGPHPQAFEITLDDEKPYLPQKVDFDGARTPYLMHPALQMFFANGGGRCYIVSVGEYKDSALKLDNEELSNGIPKIRKIDEVTLIVIPEAARLSMANNQYDIYNDVLGQCGELKDRFGIFDLREDDKDASSFRAGIGTSFLNYGAAYYPHLNTSFAYSHFDSDISFGNNNALAAFDGLTLDQVKQLTEISRIIKKTDTVKQLHNDAKSSSTDKTKKHQLLKTAVRIIQKAISLISAAQDKLDGSPINDEISAAQDLYEEAKTVADKATGTIVVNDIMGDSSDPDKQGAFPKLVEIVGNLETGREKIISHLDLNLDETQQNNIVIYFTNKFESQLQKLLNEQRITLPPSSAIAGIYAKVDGDRGVWKSPANVSINRVSGPAKKLSLEENDALNVDATGKSVNAIRSFTGKGTLVWGARTLDGNSNEWCYISVRRFFNMVEESIKKSTEPFVFEPNDANTWVKVKAMIENYLTLQWRAGALMGAKPEQAFFVKVGLGETMTRQDVLNGKMIIEIGMAAVRPAEFIILRFSHKMLKS